MPAISLETSLKVISWVHCFCADVMLCAHGISCSDGEHLLLVLDCLQNITYWSISLLVALLEVPGNCLDSSGTHYSIFFLPEHQLWCNSFSLSSDNIVHSVLTSNMIGQWNLPRTLSTNLLLIYSRYLHKINTLLYEASSILADRHTDMIEIDVGPTEFI